MSAEDRLAELLAMEPDLHALMLATVRAWAERYQPEAKWVCLTGHLGDKIPDIIQPILPLRADASQHALRRA